jgi:hypothetical protein
MNDRSDIERVLGYWLEDGPSTMHDRVIDNVARRISLRPQRQSWRSLRRSPMNQALKLAAAVAAVLVVAVVGWNLLPGNGGVGLTPSATPLPSVETATPTVAIQSAGATDSGQIPPCGPSDIGVSELRPVGGTATNTEIILILVSGSTCTIDGYPTMSLHDSSGLEVARATPDRSGVVNIQADYFFHSQFKLQSWCGPDSALPLSLEYVLDGTGIPVEGWSIDGTGGLPACQAGTGTMLSVAKWVGNT